MDYCFKRGEFIVVTDTGKIEQIAVKLLKKMDVQEGREKGYIYYHGRRTADLAVKIYSDVKMDDDEGNSTLLYIAGLFHDVGKGKAHHALAGSKMLPKLIGSELSKEHLEEVQRLVREHNLRENPNTCMVDSKALQDADTLDHFGVQGIWLSIYYTARERNSQVDMLEYFSSSEHQEYAKSKFEGLNFALSRKIFKERLAYQSEFLRRVAQEDIV